MVMRFRVVAVFMATSALLDFIDKDPFSRQDIIDAAMKEDACFKPTDIRNLLAYLLSNGDVARVARNQYIRCYNNIVEYEPVYSDEALKLITDVFNLFPYLNFQVWELSWFNEFLVHLVPMNIIFLDVGDSGCEFVYSALSEDYEGKLLLRPSDKEMQYYSKPDSIVIERMISESPVSSNNPYKPPIEKLIVELFANKTLAGLISRGDYAYMIEGMFIKYSVDQSKMFRYASRRNKKAELMNFLKENTNIRVVGG